jgi:hypothetical protein
MIRFLIKECKCMKIYYWQKQKSFTIIHLFIGVCHSELPIKKLFFQTNRNDVMAESLQYYSPTHRVGV